MADPDAGLDVATLVTRALGASYELGGALVVPTILLDREQLGEGDQRGRGVGLANVVVAWFREHGFYAERSRARGSGYGDTIKEIQLWYEFTSTYLRDQLEYKLTQYDKFQIPGQDALREFLTEQFEERLLLRTIMTEEQCDACYDTIFESYPVEDGIEIVDYRGERAGAPDLLVWHSDPLRKLWFFCEVKSYNDHLSQAQHDWIHGSWHQIGGHFLVLLLGPLGLALARCERRYSSDYGKRPLPIPRDRGGHGIPVRRGAGECVKRVSEQGEPLIQRALLFRRLND